MRRRVRVCLCVYGGGGVAMVGGLRGNGVVVRGGGSSLSGFTIHQVPVHYLCYLSITFITRSFPLFTNIQIDK